MGLGYLYLKDQRPEEAAPHLRASLELMPSAQAAYLLGEAEESMGNLSKARQLYQAVAEADSGKLGQAATAKLQRLGQ